MQLLMLNVICGLVSRRRALVAKVAEADGVVLRPIFLFVTQ
jgi:hypothetical protein